MVSNDTYFFQILALGEGITIDLNLAQPIQSEDIVVNNNIGTNLNDSLADFDLTNELSAFSTFTEEQVKEVNEYTWDQREIYRVQLNLHFKSNIK